MRAHRTPSAASISAATDISDKTQRHDNKKMNSTNLKNLKAGDRVWVKSGCYCPTSYLPNGEPVKHMHGIVSEVCGNVVAVKFEGYPNTVDMIGREIVKGF